MIRARAAAARNINIAAGNNMEKEIFDKEISMCRELSKKNNGRCNWGECEKCGVIPLLFKLAKGDIVEKENDVKELKRTALQ